MDEFEKMDNQKQLLAEPLEALLLNETKSYNLNVVLEYLEKNLEALCVDQLKLKKMLAHLHLALQTEIYKTDTIDLNSFLLNLLNKYKSNEMYIKSLLQIIYQILKTIEAENTNSKMICIKDDTMDKLIDSLFTIKNTTIKANILTCVQLYMKIYHSTDILDKIWLNIFSIPAQQQNLSHVAQILVHLCDEFLKREDFYSSQEFTDVLQQLLKSKTREERKSSLYIMKKVINLKFYNADKFMDSKEYQIWITYITLFENLEQNQSHLILPSLEILQNVKFSDVSWPEWLNILYIQTLDQPNTLVIRWMLEYIMKQYKCIELSAEVLLHFLEASNKTNLYNKEGYFLPDPYEFLSCECEVFLNTFAQINWKCLPMIYWLDGLIHMKTRWQVSFEVLLHIAGKIRCLQNPSLRLVIIKKYNELFIEDLRSMNICEFLRITETLYNISDGFNFHNLFSDKLQCNMQNIIKNETLIFTQRFYEIYTFAMPNSFEAMEDVCRYFCDKPKEHQSWLRFMIVFDCYHLFKNHEKIDYIYKFWKRHLDLDINMLEKLNLAETIAYFQNKLMWSNDEKQFIRTKSVEFFLDCKVKKFSDMYNLDMNSEDLLESGSQRTLLQLLRLLSKHNERIQERILDEFVIRIKDLVKSEKRLIEAVVYILTYIKALFPEKLEHYAEIILNFDFENIQLLQCILNYTNNLSEATIIKGILYGDSKTGDARIEDVFYIHINNIPTRSAQIRKRYIQLINERSFTDIFSTLLKQNNNITCKKPRYFEHSMEHRLKLRIATTLVCNMENPNLKLNYDDLWQILLKQNNQLNVTYMYELLTAYFTPNIQVIKSQLEKIGTYTPSQQVSVICVTHTYCLLHKISDIEQIIKELLPLTMGANFQIRLYSQLAIHNLLVEIKNISPSQIAILSAIKLTLGKQIDELLQDVRLKLHILVKPSQMNWYYAASSIMYITNASYDEYCINEINRNDLLQLRISYLKKYTPTKPCDIMEKISSIDLNNMQRKMNPIDDILTPTSIISYQECVEVEMYVVASLIDKLPNLGGIARTCEVLGIKNLILDSKKHIEQNDFKHLSMTAEKNLNIMEVKPNDLPDFLIQKQSEGYHIVGAEQTVNSVSFVNFKFPKRCVLLLGHEKEGIPGNLLGFLDYAVEIPQFGIVRSLNVHVTGALFLWEYCKQHIVTNHLK
ncbi:uncharacterized protein LOC119681513 [Teleopsis dalmanni]|uniref:uncharacterized protein LOC119681513 n=1 Tax=Teleopsis dalmanni TaxID=139649 RepID=UPI0018CEC96A|nr:uncharacterized protein LOC119681513 [Teleopsis dalmanni]